MKINKFLYYFLNLTWGIIITLIGAIVTLFLKIGGCQTFRWGGAYCTIVKGYWGGLNLGLFCFVDSYSTDSMKNHEYGHSIQNMFLGPFFIILVAIPSLIRCWIFNIRESHGKTNPDYDSIWFEGQATRWGTKTITQWQKI